MLALLLINALISNTIITSGDISILFPIIVIESLCNVTTFTLRFDIIDLLVPNPRDPPGG